MKELLAEYGALISPISRAFIAIVIAQFLLEKHQSEDFLVSSAGCSARSRFGGDDHESATAVGTKLTEKAGRAAASELARIVTAGVNFVDIFRSRSVVAAAAAVRRARARQTRAFRSSLALGARAPEAP